MTHPPWKRDHSTLEKQAQRLGIVPPTVATLRRYGMTRGEWLIIVEAQGWQCPVCEKRPRLWNIDHFHAPRWSSLPPEERRRYVRGILCVRCNWRIVDSRMAAGTAENIARYLRAYEERRDA